MTPAVVPATRPGGGEDRSTEEEEDARRAWEVLEKGSMEAWRDGTLITAPPGVTYKVGLSPGQVWKDGEEMAGERVSSSVGAALRDEVEAESAFELGDEGRGGGADRTKLQLPTRRLWDRSNFDDDSLFGESTSGSSNGSGSDNDEDDESSSEDTEDGSSDVHGGEGKSGVAIAIGAAAGGGGGR